MYTFIPYAEAAIETATSYITVAELTEINNGNIFVDYIGLSGELAATTELNLINATQILDNMFQYASEKQISYQKLEFPRLSDVDSRLNDFYVLNDNIKIATAYIAAQIKNGTFMGLINPKAAVKVQSEKADVLEKSYFESKQNLMAIFETYPYLNKLLDMYISNGKTTTINVKRA